MSRITRISGKQIKANVGDRYKTEILTINSEIILSCEGELVIENPKKGIGYLTNLKLTNDKQIAKSLVDLTKAKGSVWVLWSCINVEK